MVGHTGVRDDTNGCVSRNTNHVLIVDRGWRDNGSFLESRN